MTSKDRNGRHAVEGDRQDEILHGVLINVRGTGVLLTGAAGSGKSTGALELIARGHRLVADDVVLVKSDGRTVTGHAPDRFAGLLAVRALGILDVRLLFGENAYDASASIDFCIEVSDVAVSEPPDPFMPWTSNFEILGIPVPKLIMSAKSGGHLPVLVETAARMLNHSAVHLDVAAAHDNFMARTAKAANA